MASYRKRGKVWYFRFTDENGGKTERRGCSDLKVTKELAGAAESKVAKVRAGLVDPKDERIAREARRPIQEHIDDFVTSLESKGNAPKHVRSTRTYVERIVTLASIAWVSDLAPSALSHPVSVLKTEGLSARAVNAYLTAAKSFSRWLYRDGRTRDYSLSTLAKMNEQADRRRIRRALEPEEAARVIQAAEAGPIAGGLTGPERATLYALALGTGFRADELATLTPERFALDADPPTATVLACYAKNGSEAMQPLPSTLADRLRPWLAAKAPGRPVFEGMTERTAEMLRVDLEAAGIPYETASGVADFHALRAAYITHLISAGASVKTCQTLARHSTPSLTIGIYAKASLHDIKGAVENLPDLTPRETAPQSLAMTGTDGKFAHYFLSDEDRMSAGESAATRTDDKPISERFAHYLPTVGDGLGGNPMDADGITSSDARCSRERKPLKNKGSDALRWDLMASDGNAPHRTRTYNPLIKSQLLCQLS
jgi:integrase